MIKNSLIYVFLSKIFLIFASFLIISCGTSMNRVDLSRPNEGDTGIHGFFEWRMEGDGISIISYSGEGGLVQIPSEILRAPVKYIADHAFENRNLSIVIFPDSIVSIGNYAFMDNELLYINLGNNLLNIGSYAFAYNRLSHINLPESLVLMGENAFYGNPLTKIIIQSGNMDLGYMAIGDITDAFIAFGKEIGTYFRANHQSPNWNWVRDFLDLNGTYYLVGYPNQNWSIRFFENTYTLETSAIVSGTYEIGGLSFFLLDHNSTTPWIVEAWSIIDADSIRDSDGDIWRR